MLAGDFPDRAQYSLRSRDGLHLWWALSTSRKIQPDQPAPAEKSEAIQIRCAGNEREAAQLIVRSTRAVKNLQIRCGPFVKAGGNKERADAGAAVQTELLQVMYLDVARPSDASSLKGTCPDPLLPVHGAVDLAPETNHAFWVRVFVPSNTPAGQYRAQLELTGEGLLERIPIQLTVYGFNLPDRMTCATAFGFSPWNIFRYHNLKTDADKRQVLKLYLDNLAAHHVSPYNPAPLDPIKVKWPEARPPRSAWDDWTGLNIVSNEVHSGASSLLLHDDKADKNVGAAYQPLIKIPEGGLKLSFWYRTAVPGHRFIVSLTHHDAKKEWMHGRNNDIGVAGDGRWQKFEQAVTDFPEGAEYVRFNAWATRWTDAGESVGLVWMDDLSLSAARGGGELVAGGDFERKARTEPVVPAEQLRVSLDFTAWDAAMTEAIDRNHFNTFQVHIPGIGGGTFHELVQPELLGFGENTPEYPVLFDSYCSQLEKHLAAKGWLDEAFIYWFDEPEPSQYPFVMNGFAKLKKSCPGIARMLTEQVEPALIGGPNIWCSITDAYNHDRAEERRKYGEKFWWYVCTGPKAPYAGLFLDHAAPEMRIWLWQTFQRNIEGILVWETTYWTSSAAYPDREKPQNPYADPMSWTSGYSTPAGDRRPWGNGDGRFIYPPLKAASGSGGEPVIEGPVDSIRWEHLRDGIEDYEYLCILRKRLEEKRGRLSGEAQKRLAGLLAVPESITRSLKEFAGDGVPIERQRDLVARAVEELEGL